MSDVCAPPSKLSPASSPTSTAVVHAKAV
jgi:hypothetical protein